MAQGKDSCMAQPGRRFRQGKAHELTGLNRPGISEDSFLLYGKTEASLGLGNCAASSAATIQPPPMAR